MRTIRLRKNKKQSIKSHSIYNPYSDLTKYDDQELQAMLRSPKRYSFHGNLFCHLTQQLFWNCIHHKH